MAIDRSTSNIVQIFPAGVKPRQPPPAMKSRLVKFANFGRTGALSPFDHDHPTAMVDCLCVASRRLMFFDVVTCAHVALAGGTMAVVFASVGRRA